MKKLIILLLTMLTACRQDIRSDLPGSDNNDTLSQLPKVTSASAFQLMTASKKHPDVGGDVVDKRYWTDRNGNWCCVFTENIDIPNEFAEFRVYRFREDSSGEFQYYQLYLDSMSCGEADIVARADTKRLIISDIDNDGIGEVIFAYTLSCTYDVSPQRRVLVLNIDNIMHKLVGFTLDYGPSVPDVNDLSFDKYVEDEDWYSIPSIIAGRYEDSNDFKVLPDTFLVHANNVWLEILNAEYQEKQINR